MVGDKLGEEAGDGWQWLRAPGHTLRGRFPPVVSWEMQLFIHQYYQLNSRWLTNKCGGLQAAESSIHHDCCWLFPYWPAYQLLLISNGSSTMTFLRHGFPVPGRLLTVDGFEPWQKPWFDGYSNGLCQWVIPMGYSNVYKQKAFLLSGIITIGITHWTSVMTHFYWQVLFLGLFYKRCDFLWPVFWIFGWSSHPDGIPGHAFSICAPHRLMLGTWRPAEDFDHNQINKTSALQMGHELNQPRNQPIHPPTHPTTPAPHPPLITRQAALLSSEAARQARARAPTPGASPVQGAPALGVGGPLMKL